MKYIKQINYYINTFPFPCNYTEMSVNEISLHYGCILQCFLLLELTVSAALAHTF